jgi:hypothetical protein
MALQVLGIPFCAVTPTRHAPVDAVQINAKRHSFSQRFCSVTAKILALMARVRANSFRIVKARLVTVRHYAPPTQAMPLGGLKGLVRYCVASFWSSQIRQTLLKSSIFPRRSGQLRVFLLACTHSKNHSASDCPRLTHEYFEPRRRLRGPEHGNR